MEKIYTVYYTIKANRTETIYYLQIAAKNQTEAKKAIKDIVYTRTNRHPFNVTTKKPPEYVTFCDLKTYEERKKKIVPVFGYPSKRNY